jgi:uncharacterized protein
MHRLFGFLLLAVLAVPAVSQQDSSAPVLPGFPASSHWRNQPVAWKIDNGVLSIQAAGKTDWYIEPTGGNKVAATPVLLFPAPQDFWFSAKVTVNFHSAFDAGALVVYADEQTWVKFAFESQNGKSGSIVSVVTRGLSDDNTGAPIEGDSIYLEVSKTGQAIFLFYSTDGKNWKITRAFALGTDKPLQFGLSAQSPTGSGATAVFSEIHFRPVALKPWSGGE